MRRLRASQLRLRCAFEGCRKHALLMQRPPCDCDKCGRPLQHPMRSFWEFQAEMAEAVQVGVTSAQLCSHCYKEERQGTERRGGRAAPSSLATAVVTLGSRQVPLAGFVEVEIRGRRQLNTEQPEDSEQQSWVQCASCRLWHHWVCALYNPKLHAYAQGGGGEELRFADRVSTSVFCVMKKGAEKKLRRWTAWVAA